MKLRLLALPLLVGVGLVPVVAAAAEKDDAKPADPATNYAGTVDPAAFRPVPHKKLGTVTTPATVRLITPGIDKFSIYRLIGPPHFGETITRRWDYVLFFPPTSGSTERMRCRMALRFIRHRGRYNVVVSQVIWQDQACADRVAAAG